MPPFTLAAMPATTQQFAAVRGNGTKLSIDSALDHRSIDDIKSQLESEVEVWLISTRYRRAAPKERSRDATDEFLKWRKGTMVGVSAP
jgi:hypothetical protein